MMQQPSKYSNGGHGSAQSPPQMSHNSRPYLPLDHEDATQYFSDRQPFFTSRWGIVSDQRDYVIDSNSPSQRMAMAMRSPDTPQAVGSNATPSRFAQPAVAPMSPTSPNSFSAIASPTSAMRTNESSSMLVSTGPMAGVDPYPASGMVTTPTTLDTSSNNASFSPVQDLRHAMQTPAPVGDNMGLNGSAMAATTTDPRQSARIHSYSATLPVSPSHPNMNPNAVADPQPQDVVEAAVALSRTLPLDYRSPNTIKPTTRIRQNDARVKWDSVSFNDTEAVQFRERLTKDIKELRRSFRNCNTKVVLPDQVADEALSYAAPKHGTQWETFDISKHADFDAQVRADKDKQLRQEAAFMDAAAAAADEGAPGRGGSGERSDNPTAPNNLWVFTDVKSGGNRQHGAKGADEERLEEADRLQARLNEREKVKIQNGSRERYTCFMAPSKKPTQSYTVTPKAGKAIDNRDSLSNHLRFQEVKVHQAESAATSNVPYTDNSELSVIEKDILEKAAQQRQAKATVPPPQSHLDGISPFFTSGVAALDRVPIDKIDPMKVREVRTWQQLLDGDD